jgi:capsid protein
VVRGRSQWDKVEIQMPPATWADPQDAADTDAKNLNMGTDSHSAVIGRRGGNITDLWEQRAKDEKLRQTIARKHGVDPDKIANVQIAGAAPNKPAEAVKDDKP